MRDKLIWKSSDYKINKLGVKIPHQKIIRVSKDNLLLEVFHPFNETFEGSSFEELTQKYKNHLFAFYGRKKKNVLH